MVWFKGKARTIARNGNMRETNVASILRGSIDSIWQHTCSRAEIPISTTIHGSE